MLPSKQENLKYSDWAKMVSGLMDDTPLGRVVWVRSENDEDMLKNFTPEQKQIRQEWRDFQYQSAPKVSEEEQRKQIDLFEKMFASMFG